MVAAEVGSASSNGKGRGEEWRFFRPVGMGGGGRVGQGPRTHLLNFEKRTVASMSKLKWKWGGLTEQQQNELGSLIPAPKSYSVSAKFLTQRKPKVVS